MHRIYHQKQFIKKRERFSRLYFVYVIQNKKTNAQLREKKRKTNRNSSSFLQMSSFRTIDPGVQVQTYDILNIVR